MTFTAIEWDLTGCLKTGRTMTFIADDIDEAAARCAYTLNLKERGWRALGTGRDAKRWRVVAKKTGDLSWTVTPDGERRGVLGGEHSS